MGLFFRDKPSRNEKLFTVFFMLSLFFAIYGAVTNFTPSEWIRENIGWSTFAVALVYFIPVQMDRHPGNRIRSFPFPKKALFYCGILLFTWAIAFSLVAYSVPSIVTSLNGSPHRFLAVIESKNYQGKGCRNALKIEGVGYGINDKVCVDEFFWEKARVGDQVQVYVTKSALGMKVIGLAFNDK